jgi:hypothetical protein
METRAPVGHTPLAISIVLLAAFGCGVEPRPPTPSTDIQAIVELSLEAAPQRLGVAGGDDVPWRPHAPALVLTFEAEANAGEQVLSLLQLEVESSWTVAINGAALGQLARHGSAMIHHFVIPPRTLVDGSNRLTISPSQRSKPGEPTDLIEISEIVIRTAPLDEALGLGRVQVATQTDTGEALPARLSILDAAGRLVVLTRSSDDNFAIRPGVAYVGEQGRELWLPAGDYELAATRGMEWSRARQSVHVEPKAELALVFSLQREVDTRGWIAADTHVHTLTFSGHGDVSIEERMLTLAGEGVELAVATDHNHHTDYRPHQTRQGLQRWFTSVVGNEVTTDNGHFNAFPLAVDAEPPEHRHADWVTLIEGIREAGAKVVVLNHPHWPQRNSSPFAGFGLDPMSGDRASPMAFTFDAMELVNSTTLDPDPLALFHDWFALLARGEIIVAVGASDSHTVRDPVGQGRCYVPSKTDDPAKIDVDASIEAYLGGRVSVSLGIFTELRVHVGAGVDDSGIPGDTLSTTEAELAVDVRVAAPGWIRPRVVLIFVDGVQAAELSVPTHDEKPTDTWLSTKVAVPSRDATLLAVVLGDGVELPGWPLLADYTLAATNPVYLDRDGRPGWMPLRAAAQARLDRAGKSEAAVEQAIEDEAQVDPALANQMSHLYALELDARARPLPDWLDERLTKWHAEATHSH